MFDQDIWRRNIAEQLKGFARNPRQEMQLAGAPSLFSFLVARTLAPFLDAFQREPIAAVLTLAAIRSTADTGGVAVTGGAAGAAWATGAGVCAGAAASCVWQDASTSMDAQPRAAASNE